MTAREYFEQLAAQHKLVRHTDEEPHFSCSSDDAATLMARRLFYPAVFFEEGDLLVADELWQEVHTLAFVTHVEDTGNEREKADAFHLTKNLMRDFIARMIRDRRKGLAPMQRFSPSGAQGFRVELSDAGLYGWLLVFNLTTSLTSLNCNDNFDS